MESGGGTLIVFCCQLGAGTILVLLKASSQGRDSLLRLEWHHRVSVLTAVLTAVGLVSLTYI